ncbi:MAG: TRAM domain-containing protein [Acholeplasmataceae bacterium]
MQTNLKINDIINLDIKRMGINGEGIGFFNRLAIFVDGAIPGEKILAKITKVYNNRAIAEIDDVLNDSINRTVPICPLFGDCGGCQLQHIKYEKTLEFKKDIIKKAFLRYIKPAQKINIKNTFSNYQFENYRHEATLPLKQKDNSFSFGLNSIKTTDFIKIDHCYVHHLKINDIYNLITTYINENNITNFSINSVTIKISNFNGDVLIVFNLNDNNKLDNLIEYLINNNLSIKSIYQNIDNNYQLLYGKDYIVEKILNTTIKITPNKYLHPNPVLLNDYYQIIFNYINNINPESIEIILADNQIFYELLIDNNQKTIKHQFKSKYNLTKELEVLYLEPNKSGLNYYSLNQILINKPKNIIYSSSNPSTLAKDLNKLKDIYEIKEVIPFDMFPLTSLVESLTFLKLK